MRLYPHVLAVLLALVLFPIAGNRISHLKDKDSFRDGKLRCVICLNYPDKNLDRFATGFNYEILKAFGKSHSDSISVELGEGIGNHIDSIALGGLDILVIPASEYKDTADVAAVAMGDSSIIWVLGADKHRSRELVRWFAKFQGSAEYSEMKRRFSLKGGMISPYDDILKANAQTIGWDWRLLAALAWSESKFRIQAKSPRGALGIMQMMPVTADRFGVRDPLDPEENIAAGTRYLAFLKDMLSRYTEDPETLTWLTIAAYNSGGGRALQDLEGKERSSATAAYTEAVIKRYVSYGGKAPSVLLSPDSLGGIDPGDEETGDQEEEHDDNE
ncbi:MAG: transglycosylase SLT domain-containing protein [Bacteroidales bacterium]|nr:transglycosylase SLT domain-containing protein [Bacteroidales bacterium]